MSSDEISTEVRDYGKMVDASKNRVTCNLCTKEMSGFSRLKYHLGAVGPDVTACPQVPENVKQCFKNMLAESRRCSVGRKACLGKRDRSATSNSSNHPLYIDSESEDAEAEIPTTQMKEMQDYEKKIKRSWATTGCTVSLDCWTDENGRELLSFIADSPAGSLYLDLFDISDPFSRIDTTVSRVEDVIRKVGVDNVVQVMACSSTGWIGKVAERYQEMYPTIFWSVSASYCIELMLEEIGKMETVRITLNKAKNLTKYYKSLVRPSKIRSATAFLTVENIILQKEKLMAMFAGRNLACANEMEGHAVTNLMEDSSFWKEVEAIVKASKPLINLLCSFNMVNEPKVGKIYELMDEIKITIRENLGDKNYVGFWDAIDKVWNTRLHSHLHAAGHYLNPATFYSGKFRIDEEVSNGMIECIVRTMNKQEVQLKMIKQFLIYQNSQGDFEEGAIDEAAKHSPVEWWTRYGAAYPELQRFATRIISQTCDGASKYRLKRILAEKMIGQPKTEFDRQYLKDSSFVEYNLQLQQSKLSLNGNIMADKIDPNDDWVNQEGENRAINIPHLNEKIDTPRDDDQAGGTPNIISGQS